MKFLVLALILSFYAYSQNYVLSPIDGKRLIVKLKQGAKAPQSNYALGEKKLFGNYFVYRTNNVEALKNDLSQMPEVASVDYNYRWINKKWPKASKVAPQSLTWDGGTPNKNIPLNDPMLSRMWGLAEETQGLNLYNHLNYVAANDLKKEKVLVAVVDTGVDVKHPELNGKIWVNKNEVAGNGIDDDNNGYVDDINGIDTLTRDSQGRASAHRIDGHGHGTHVSGTIAALQNNNIGIAGVSSHAEIMAIRTVPANGDETDIDVAESFIYAAKMGARIINCSFGKSAEEQPGLVSDAIAEILKINNTLVVASAGNDGQNIDIKFKYPASLQNENLIVVNAIGNGGRLTGFSNYGVKNSDIAAPGAGVLSTTPNNKYASWDGTSMASPHITGAAAEILSLYPKLSAIDLKAILMKAAKPQPSLKGKSATGGSIDINLARQLALELVKNKKLHSTSFQNSRI